MAPQAGLEPATLRLTVAARGFWMELYRVGTSRTINDLTSILFSRRVIPICPIFHAEGAQKGAQYCGRIHQWMVRPFFVRILEPTSLAVDAV